MEKISEVNTVEIEKSKYQDIVPNGETINPNDFWDSKFDDMSYESLLSDCFNRSEDEFEFNIMPGKKLMETLSLIDEANWKELLTEEKEDIIESVIDGICEQLGIEDIPFVAYYEADEYDCGFYDHKDNSVCINEMYLNDPKEMISILVHELRHAYQQQRADIGETRQDLLYHCNFENYITPIELPNGGYLLFFDYRNQYVEAEARAYSKAFMEAVGW